VFSKALLGSPVSAEIWESVSSCSQELGARRGWKMREKWKNLGFFFFFLLLFLVLGFELRASHLLGRLSST
jgi:hypothetical protein